MPNERNKCFCCFCHSGLIPCADKDLLLHLAGQCLHHLESSDFVPRVPWSHTIIQNSAMCVYYTSKGTTAIITGMNPELKYRIRPHRNIGLLFNTINSNENAHFSLGSNSLLQSRATAVQCL